MLTIDGRHFYTLEEVSEKVDCSFQTVVKYAKRGRLGISKVGSKRYVSDQNLIDFLNGKSKEGN